VTLDQLVTVIFYKKQRVEKATKHTGDTDNTKKPAKSKRKEQRNTEAHPQNEGQVSQERSIFGVQTNQKRSKLDV